MCVICRDTSTNVVICIPRVTVPRSHALRLLFLHSDGVLHPWGGTRPPAAAAEASLSNGTRGGKERKAGTCPPCCAPFYTASRALPCRPQLMGDTPGGWNIPSEIGVRGVGWEVANGQALPIAFPQPGGGKLPRRWREVQPLPHASWGVSCSPIKLFNHITS